MIFVGSGIKLIYDPTFDIVTIHGVPSLIIWYNTYDKEGNIIRERIILWH